MKKELGKKLLKIILIIVNMAAVVMLLAFSGFLFPKNESQLEPPLKSTQVVEYETYEVERTTIEDRIVITAYTVANRKVDVLFNSEPGYLRQIAVNSGDTVFQGQVLASLESESLMTNLARQEILVENSRDRLAQYISLSEIEIELLEMKLNELKLELDIYEALPDSISEYELIKLQNNYKSEQYKIEQQRLRDQFEISSLTRQVTLDTLELERMERDYNNTVLRSPINGQIDYISSIRPGEWVNSYQKLFSISDLSRMLLKYSGIKYSSFIKGMAVDIEFDGEIYSGKVHLTPDEIAAEDRDTMGTSVWFSFDNIPPTLFLGARTEVTLIRDSREDVLVLPKRFVHNYVSRKYVKVYENGLIKEVDVELGIESATDFEIIAGLNEGDLVVE